MNENKFKIIKIIDDYKVVINTGKNNKVKKGDKFEIYIKGVELKDEETGTSYGTLDYVKAIVEAVEVFEKASVCENVETYTEKQTPTLQAGLKSLNGIAASLYGYGEEKTYIKPLEVDQSQVTGYGVEIDKTIRIGDLVRKRD